MLATMAIPVRVLFLLLALAPLSHSAVFLNIDCGSSKSFTGPDKLKWIGDDSLIKSGESHQVVEISTSAPQEMSTLRAFTTRNKNCYSIEAGRGEKVLVRARFNYGNYDKKSSPPTFELQFDGNYWATVETTADSTVFYEVIYVLKGDHTSICLAQTHPNQFPFISALEVRSIDSKMYTHVHSNFALLSKHTVAYGASKAISYPDDPYDRIWTPEEVDNGYTAVTNNGTSIKVEVPEMPPEAVLMNAVTSSSTSEPLILATQVRTASIPIYLIMYFSEVTQLDSDQKRSFVFCIDSDIASDPIVPPYGSVFELYLTNTTATPNTTFSLIATTDSTLPPLINAMELFYVVELTDGTNSKDVEGLATLQSKFSVLKEWTGDPCLPSTFTWDWVNCSSDPAPRVTALYLNGYGLSGSLPDFSSLDALETIDFQNNSLTGSIPDFLGTFPNLKELNLADNNLGGSIPTSLSKNKELDLVISGNSELCSSSSNLCEKTKTKNSSGGTKKPSSASTNKKISDLLPIIVGATILSFFVFF